MAVKLLIADSEEMIRNEIAKYIELHTDRFDKIYLAENGQQAMDLIFRKTPDLMLLDVQMPIKNGMEVVREARDAGILPATIILSGSDEAEYARQTLRYGARDYLLKSCRLSDILKKLLEVTDELFGTGKIHAEGLEFGSNYLVDRAMEYINDHYFENLTLQQVADEVGISSGYLSTLFTHTIAIGFADYLNEVRIENACTYLQQKNLKTYEIAFKVGYKNEKYFSKVFKKVRGLTPSEFRKVNGVYS